MLFALDLTGQFSAGGAIIAGIIGALVMLVVMYGGKAMGMTSMDLLKTLGTMMVPKAADSTAYGIGMMMHLMMGAAFGIVHAGVLTAIDPSTSSAATWISVGLGVVHGMMVLVAMPMMLNMAHPLVKDGTMDKPGTAMMNFGTMTPMGVTMGHVVFALVTGALYVAGVS